LSQDFLIIRVVHADALTYPADLLVLKYAQALYGVDEAVVRTLGLDEISFTGDVVLRMKQRIGAARIVVADLTDANPNVYLELATHGAVIFQRSSYVSIPRT
jgi:hypothetical protein